MAKTRVLHWVAIAGGVALVVELISGLVLWFAVSGGQGPLLNLRHSGGSFAGIERGVWIDVHDWAGLVLVAVMLLHLALHWRWLVRQTKAIFGAETSARA